MLTPQFDERDYAVIVTVSAEHDKMRQIHQESQGPGQDIRKTTPAPRGRIGCASGKPNPSMLAPWLSQATNQAHGVAKIAGIIMAQSYDRHYG